MARKSGGTAVAPPGVMTVILFNLLLVGCCGYALVFGAAPERIGAVTMIAATILTVLASSPQAVRFRSVEDGILLVDVATLVAFLALSLHSRRFWPLWITGVQGLAVACHIAKMWSTGVIPWVYASVITLSSYPMLLLLAAGTWRHRVRLRRDGVDPSWSTSSNRLRLPRRRGGPID